MKRVLMIVPFFPPMAGGGVHRPLAFARYLPRHGWTPTVITQRPDAYWIHDPELAARARDVDVVRTTTWSGQAVAAKLRRVRGATPDGQAARSSSSSRRSSRAWALARRLASTVLVPDAYVGWKPFALRAARRVLAAGAFDAIYSTSPPETSHLVAMRLHRETGLPWVADFRDPWMNLHLLEPPTPLHAAWHRRLERAVCERATCVVTTTWHEADLRRRYPRARVVRISNGYDGEAIDAALAGGDDEPDAGTFRVVHAGMLTQRRSAEPFLQALSRVLESDARARDEVRVTFVGPREDANDRAARRLGLGDVVRFEGSVSHSVALRTMRSAHVLLLIKHDDPRYRGMVPGKLYEYLALRRPILALAPPGEARELVEGLRRGRCAEPGDVAGIARALSAMLDDWRRDRLDDAFDLEPVPRYDRAHLAEDLAAVLDAAAAGD